MRHGRPTTEPKGEFIKLRISKDMKSWLEREAERTGKSLSDIVRQAVKNEMQRKMRF